ncbi:alpha-glucosidase/alpha-galactosidase [Nibricoccus aquaticus]|uniref:Alpha-glucosidase/alpha-galactosidase n=1 Tax=Nibricoccus aquaticus TaxID=2576891 RepID=A0A290QAG8_9BACT|nr:alpha-glucosidase/alpha-galactosidase [Nibricoccus aquaticus]ATC65423.1 alpha-glucosidase/alpha-galactosidase [Nibricoccus aquaticus]
MKTKSSPSSTSGKGHAAHTQSSAVSGLPGAISRKIKLAFLGAGSFFTPRLVNDLVRIPGERGGTIALVDIDEKRLRVSARLVRQLLASIGKAHWKLVTSTDRVEVLKDSDYVVNCIEVSGLECVRWDNDIPLKYGVDQCIGDTIGPGGLFKALRTIPVWLKVLKDCERLCPDALVLNYTNPMAMLCTAAARTSSMKVVGLCHSVQHTSDQLARYAGVPVTELEWECAGINHLAWFTRLTHAGRDLYPDLKARFARDVEKALADHAAGNGPSDSEYEPVPLDRDIVRKDMCLRFGAFITESSGHLSEYLPYYRKSAAGRAYLRRGYDGGSRFYATHWPTWRANADRDRNKILRGELAMDWPRSWEYASWIIEAKEKNSPFRIHGNVMNSTDGGGPLIANLPAWGCIEVACLIDANGVQPIRYGALPRQMAAVSASNLSFFDLGAEAAINRSVETAVHALLLDPLTSAVCTPAQIEAMTLELFAAEKAFLPEYR